MLSLVSGQLSAQLIYETVWVDYDSAWEYKSLKLVPVRAKDLGGKPGRRMISLNKALEQGIATVSERGSASTENVHWLRVKNNSDQSIYVGAGQTFTGGRQDRMVSKDTILTPTGKDQYISVMCIEEDRWSEKEKKILFANYANMKLRLVLDKTKNQASIWKEIYAQLDSANFTSPTLAYNALKHKHKNLLILEDEYLKYFRKNLNVLTVL